MGRHSSSTALYHDILIQNQQPVNHTCTKCCDHSVSFEQFITLPHSELNKRSPHIPKLAYSMERSPSLEPNRFTASQEIPHILCNPKVHYRIYKSPPPVPILSQLYPVHTPTPHLLKIHLNIILQPMPRSPKWSLSLRFPQQNPVYALLLPHACYLPCPSHSS